MTRDARDSQLSAMFDGELPDAERELVARRLARDAGLREVWSSYALIGAVMRGEPLASDPLAPRVAASIARPEVALAVVPDTTRRPTGGRPGEAPPRLPRWAVPASGVGLAAGIAVVAVFALLWTGGQPTATMAGASIVPRAASRVAEVVIPATPNAPDAPDARVARDTSDARVAPAAPGAAPVTAQRGSAVASPRRAEGATEAYSYVTPPADPRRATVEPPPWGLAGYVGAHSLVSAPLHRHSTIAATIAPESTASESPGESVR